MKNSIYLLTFFFMCTIFSNAFAQKQKNFREHQYLISKNNYYLTSEDDPTVYLYKEEAMGMKKDTIHIGISGTDTTIHYKEVKNYKGTAFKISDFSDLKLTHWKGDFKIEKDKIYFYPWKFKDEGDNELYDKLSKYKYYIKIPERTVVGINFYSFQFGTLTLPAKVFVSSSADTLINNVQTGVNLNAFVGIKIGKKKYYYLRHQEKGKVYERSFSLNWVTGFSKIDITKNNTTPKVDEDFSIAGWSNGLALGFQYQSIGLYVTAGIDTPIGEFGKDWNYRNQPWVGIGIGLGL